MIRRIFSFLLVALVSVTLLSLTVRGNVDPETKNLMYQNSIDSRVTGPFESTGSTSRYVLTQAIAQRGTFFLTESEARAAAPDMVRVNDTFISIFTPGISFAALPFYYLGSFFGTPQIGTYLVTALAALANVFLIMLLARRLGANALAGIIAGFTFLAATNAFTYAQSLTQHHLSTTTILLALYLALLKRSLISNLFLGLVFGIAILFDIPNGFMLIPVMLYAGLSHIKAVLKEKKYTVSINFIAIFLVIGMLLSLSVFGWYNVNTTGSATLIGQNIGRSNYFDSPEKQAQDARDLAEAKANGASFLPFDTRVQLESLYILVISDERGWVYYAPVVFLGLIGFALAYRSKTHKTAASLIMIVITTNIVIYSMFGDPWGGWSFGARYLIPGAALMLVLGSVALTGFRRNFLVLIPFLLLFVYGSYVNSLGAFTTAAIPPKGEAQALSTPLPHTYAYNFQLADIDRSSSLIYNMYLTEVIPLHTMIAVLSALASVSVLILLVLLWTEKHTKGEPYYE